MRLFGANFCWLGLSVLGACVHSLPRTESEETRDPAYVGGKAVRTGVPTLQIGQFGTDTEFACSAVKIADRLVLTAAHCVLDDKKPILDLKSGDVLGVRDLRNSGSWTIRKTYLPEPMRRQIRREPYDWDRSIDAGPDLAILEMEEDLSLFKKVPLEEGSVRKNDRVLSGGFGCRSLESYGVEDADKVALIDRGNLKKWPLTVGEKRVLHINASTISTGVKDEVLHAVARTCSGDSGGPLYKIEGNKILSVVGITSRHSQPFQIGSVVLGPEFDVFARVDGGTTGYSVSAWLGDILAGRARAGF